MKLTIEIMDVRAPGLRSAKELSDLGCRVANIMDESDRFKRVKLICRDSYGEVTATMEVSQDE